MSCRIRFCLRFTCLLLAVACSGEESFVLPPVAFGAPSTRYQDACKAWAVSNCDYQERCQGAQFPWQSSAQCVERTALSCELMAADPGVSFNEDTLRACPFPSDCALAPPNCWLQGANHAGAPCLWNEACRSGLCFNEAAGICGLCVCDITCPVGQGCLIGGSGETCVPLKVGPGKPCVSRHDCQSDVCAASDAGPTVCAPFGQFGDPCNRDGIPVCDPASFVCDPGTQQCNVTSLVGFGESCVEDGGPLPGCKGFASCLGGTCVPPASDGQRCDQGPACAWPAECIDNHCVFPTIADCSL